MNTKNLYVKPTLFPHPPTHPTPRKKKKSMTITPKPSHIVVCYYFSQLALA